MSDEWLQTKIEDQLDWWIENMYLEETDRDPRCRKCGALTDIVTLKNGHNFRGCVMYPRCR